MNTTYKVLILDDDVATRERLVDLLATRNIVGVQVPCMNDLTEEVMTDADALLLDLLLPESEGQETLDEVAKRVNERFPVVILTGTQNYDFGKDSISGGEAYDFVSKVNWDDNEIVDKILSATGKHALMAEFYNKLSAEQTQA